MHSVYRKILRSITFHAFRFVTRRNWSLLRYYPHVIPDDTILQDWQSSEWPEYQEWINKHSLLTGDQWSGHHDQAVKASGRIKISIVTPVFNTDPEILSECIFSVRLQTSPFWEFILVDDGSTNEATHGILGSRICKDPRIKVIYADKESPKGISAATNRAIDAAGGEYIVFLDHDDRLAPEAIQSLIAAIEEDPDLDIIYSDRDMLSPGGKRFMHLMKPEWSPENLYGGNYIFHLMCYRRKLILQAGKLRSEYDGSQDYDLILRCMEFLPKIKHLPQVLYHWRQHANSVAMEEDSKNYAFEAGMAALRDALRRRKIEAKVSENKSLWRGNYQIELPLPPEDAIGYIFLPPDLPPEKYAATIRNNPLLETLPPYIFIQSGDCSAEHVDSARILASWLELENIGIASGLLVNKEQTILYAGMVHGENGEVFAPYAGHDISEPGYMAATCSARNISIPNPFSVMIRRELWQQLGGFDSRFQGPNALLDFALTALQAQWRIVFVPRAFFTCSMENPSHSNPYGEQKTFYRKWEHVLQKGDPYYSPNLKKNSPIYELA